MKQKIFYILGGILLAVFFWMKSFASPWKPADNIYEMVDFEFMKENSEGEFQQSNSDSFLMTQNCYGFEGKCIFPE